jgi:putative tributyrin esterase
MVWSDFHFYSPTLQMQTQAYVLLPEYDTLHKLGGGPLPTLYLLHGLSDDHTGWMRDTRIEKYANKYALAVVMPAANRSFYTDMAQGAKYWTYISEELPRVMESYFPLSTTREGRFAAGLSMGGYGAMKLGLLRPENYAAIAAFSAPLMLQEVYQFPAAGIDRQELDNLFGGEAALRTGENNLCLAAARLSPAAAPRMYVSCGTKDFLFEANQAFAALFAVKFGIRYETVEGAAHTSAFWDREIEKALAWMPLQKVENVW